MPATPFFAAQFVGQTNATLNVPDYQIELLAINQNLTEISTQLFLQLTLLNQTVAFNTGPTGLATPGTLSASLNAMSRSLINLSNNSASILEKQGELVSAIGSVQTSVSRVSSTINAGVTTQQMALSDQIQNNKFQQITTNAALERADLPPTEVPAQALSDKVKETIDTVGDLKTQVFAAGVVERGLTEAITWTATTVQNNIAETYIGAGAASAWGTLKGWLAKVNAADFAKKTKTETDAIQSSTQTA
jgi:hypothetical protein